MINEQKKWGKTVARKAVQHVKNLLIYRRQGNVAREQVEYDKLMKIADQYGLDIGDLIQQGQQHLLKTSISYGMHGMGERKMRFPGPGKRVRTVQFEQADRMIWRELTEMALDPQKVAGISRKKNWSQQKASGYLSGIEAAKQGDRFAGLGQQEWRATDDFAMGYKEGFRDGEYSANLPALRA